MMDTSPVTVVSREDVHGAESGLQVGCKTVKERHGFRFSSLREAPTSGMGEDPDWSDEDSAAPHYETGPMYGVRNSPG